MNYLPFKCRRCGGDFCNAHRMPESHDCVDNQVIIIPAPLKIPIKKDTIQIPTDAAKNNVHIDAKLGPVDDKYLMDQLKNLKQDLDKNVKKPASVIKEFADLADYIAKIGSIIGVHGHA